MSYMVCINKFKALRTADNTRHQISRYRTSRHILFLLMSVSVCLCVRGQLLAKTTKPINTKLAGIIQSDAGKS